MMLLSITACGGGSDSSTQSEPAIRTLQIGQTQTEFISVEGEVDTYRIRAAEANRYLHLRCEEKMSGSKVDLLVTVFEESNGRRRRLFGKHKPNGATLGADLDLWVFIDSPKDLVITVRDLMDDDASQDIPYYLRATFEDSADGNHNFSSALPISVGASSISDAIDEIGEVDCFTFAVAEDGVHSVRVDHYTPLGGTPVQLAIALYDNNGNLIQKIADPYHVLLSYLTSENGPYFVTIEDSDSLNADAGAPYEIAVETIAAQEAVQNDTNDDAFLLTPGPMGEFTATGAIDYGSSSLSLDQTGDMDWYRFAIGDTGGETTYHLIEMTIDDGETVEGTAPHRIIVYDADLEIVTSHDFSPGGNAYQNQFRTQNGEYFIAVAPANAKRLDRSTTYSVMLKESDLSDMAETSDDNTANSAIELLAQNSEEGLISYHSDVDWYSLEVDTTSPQILSVSLTAGTSIVDYQLTLWRGDQLIKKVTDMDGSDGPTHLKTSVLVPEDLVASTTIYHFKVCDAQNNEGCNEPYTITADSRPVVGNPGNISETIGKTVLHYSETDIEANETDEVELEIFSNLQPNFKANTSWLDFRNPSADGVSQTDPGDGTTIITFPWISGYVDYQGDRDFFQIDLGKMDPDGAETTWYYDVQIRLVVPAPGSEVEYVWKLYRDSNRNTIIMDDPSSPDGYKACAGDTTPLTTDTIDLVTPQNGEDFWIGSEWGENSLFYVGVSDFNYLQLPNTDLKNALPDNDWGYDAPYYFTLTLIYHPGKATPDEL